MNIGYNKEYLDWVEITDLVIEILTKDVMLNKIFIYGAGRSGFIGRCFAQRLMHIGINACFLSDAITYAYTDNDLLIIISNSGETTSSKALAQKAKEIGGDIAVITGDLNSTIARLSDITIRILNRDDEVSLVPYTGLFDISTLAVLDSIIGILMEKIGITNKDIDKTHATVE